MSKDAIKVASVSDLFGQTARMVSGSVDASVQLQAGLATWWTETMSKGWERQSKAALRDTVPAGRQAAADYLQLFDHAWQTSFELLKKAAQANCEALTWWGGMLGRQGSAQGAAVESGPAPALALAPQAAEDSKDAGKGAQEARGGKDRAGGARKGSRGSRAAKN